MKKGLRLESFFVSPMGDESGEGQLRFLALHHHLALVVELAFVPVGAVRQVCLTRGGTGAHVGWCQSIVGAALARARFALPSFGMCHGALVVESFQCCPAWVDVVAVFSIFRGIVLPLSHAEVTVGFLFVDDS